MRRCRADRSLIRGPVEHEAVPRIEHVFPELAFDAAIQRSDGRNEELPIEDDVLVDREHRGHALGKWLKSAVILHGLERWPEADDIETMNAFSNEAMLGINREIGFEHEFTVRTYRVPARQVLDRLV